MRNRLLCLFLLLSAGFQAVSQHLDTRPDLFGAMREGVLIEPAGTAMQTEAHLDLLFSYNATDSASASGQAAVAYVNGEIWTSRWQNDTLYRFDSTGSFLGVFKILDNGTPVSGTRALTWDGNKVYMVNNSTTIFEVDPLTYNVTAKFTIPTINGSGARWITFDPDANSGAGGFWVGNFNTDLRQISRTGSTLTTISAATHGITGMYGAALDTVSTGGPYLWVFTQGGNGGTIRQVKLSAPVAVIPQAVDATTFLTVSGPLAGGAFLSQDIVPGTYTLMGLMQGTPNTIFGIEIDYNPTQVDAILATLSYTPGYGKVPEKLLSPLNLSGTVQNGGSDTLNAVTVNLEVALNGVPQTPANQSVGAILPLTTATFSVPFTPAAKGLYEFTAFSSLAGQTDEFPSSDTLTTFFEVTDSVYARDNGIANAANYSVSSADKAIALTVFDFPQTVFVKGVELVLGNPTAGDTTYAALVLMQGNSPAGAPILTGLPVVISDTVNTYYLPFPASFPAQAGSKWGIGVGEDNGPLGVAASTNNFVTGINFFTTNFTTFAWTPSNLPTVRFIRPVIATCNDFTATLTATPDSGQNTGTLGSVVLGASGSTTYAWTDSATGATVGNLPNLINIAAGTYILSVADQNGCAFSDTIQVIRTLRVGIEQVMGLSAWKAYPNPARDQLRVELGWQQVVSPVLSLTDLQGKTLVTKALPSAEFHTESVDVSQLAPGMYLLRVDSERGTTSRLISVQK
jgi:hypothetical protein